MQSSVITSPFSSGCCCRRSINVAISSSAGPAADGCASYAMLGMRRRGKLANSTALRANNKSFLERIGSRCDGVVVVRSELAQGGGGSLDEKLKNLNSEKAVGGMQGFDRSARLIVDELKPGEHTGTTRNLELQAEEKAFETDESFGRKEPVLDVASDSAVDPEHAHEHIVAKAGEVAPELGLSEEDLTTALEDRAEEASSRDAELLKTDISTDQDEDGVGQVLNATKESGLADEDGEREAESGELTRDEATEKILDVAREGMEVLKWAVEGLIAAGANSRGGLKVAKQIIDKRLKSFNIAAEETKDVSAQLSEVARSKYEELQGSASIFNQQLQVQIEDKKAADELKPDSQTSPLAQLSRGVQASIDVATKEGGPLAKLGQSLQENVVKLGTAGQEMASFSSSQGTADKSSEVMDRLVPVGEKEGFFQDLAPADGSSPKPGDMSAEASDILGQDNVADGETGEKEDKQEYEGFFGDIPVNRSVSSPTDGAQPTLTTGGNTSVSKIEEDHQGHEGFFGNIPVDSRSATSATADTNERTPTTSGKASTRMRDEYEHEVGNDQLKETQQLGPDTSYSTDASSEQDPASAQSSVKDKDEMGIGPDE